MVSHFTCRINGGLYRFIQGGTWRRLGYTDGAPLCCCIWNRRSVAAICNRLSTAAGIGVGLTSPFAHGAGPVVNIFMLPQSLPKVEFISTRVLIFTWINWIKMPFFIGWGLVTTESLRWDLVYLPVVPVGVCLGVRLNRKISEEKFSILIYVLTLLAGLHLIIGSLSP